MPNIAPVFTGGSVGSNSMIFTPLRLAVKFLVSKQLLAQAAPVFEPILRDQISRAISGRLDDLALFGTGSANGQPLGVFATVTPVNLGATPMTWINFKGYQQNILQTDLDPDSFGVIVSPSMQAYLDQTLAYSGGSYLIWEKIKANYPQGCFIGNEINTSTPMASGKGMFVGMWRFLYIMLWGSGLELQFDPYTSADTNETVVRVTILKRWDHVPKRICSDLSKLKVKGR